MSTDEALEVIAHELRLATASSRVTIRIRAGESFPVTAESCVDGVASLRGVPIDPRGSATFSFLSLERRLLVQDDVLQHELAPPREIVATYGIRAQMVAPVIARGELGALISVHDVAGARSWSSREQQAIGLAAAEVAQLIGDPDDQA